MSKCNDGFSLLEVLVAMAIISMAAAAALGLTAQLSRNANAAQEKAAVEALGGFALNTAIAEHALSGVANQTFAPPFSNYQFSLQTQRIDALLRKYSVTVSDGRTEARLTRTVLDTLTDQ